MLSIDWHGDAATGYLRLLDQTKLPTEIVYRDCRTVEEVWDAIKRLQVRGAPAIGVAAAYGVVLGVRAMGPQAGHATSITKYLRTSRPTAVNLFWALDRMERLLPLLSKGRVGEGCFDSASTLSRGLETPPSVPPLRGGRNEGVSPQGRGMEELLREAQAIHAEDIATCKAIGEYGAPLIPDGGGVLTHCNTGALATADYGTALAALFIAHQQGKRFTVYVDETRPLLQGARLTAWELQQRGIEAVLICDNMAAQVMKEGKVQLAIVGADRIAANGDTANKIGTYGVAVLAKHHGIPFYIAAPKSTFDLSLPDGSGIPIEQRAAEEITEGFGRRTAPAGIKVYNPAFDVTPAALLTGIVTEAGLIQPVNSATIQERLGPRRG